MFKWFLSVILVAGLIGWSGCNDPNQFVSVIPNVPVSIVLTVSNPQFINLNTVGGYVQITGGSRGIIVYRASFEEFRAFDRHCPYNVDEGCRVTVNSSSIIASDDQCCGSEFLIVDGSVTQGPSALPLKGYATSFDGNNLFISN